MCWVEVRGIENVGHWIQASALGNTCIYGFEIRSGIFDLGLVLAVRQKFTIQL